jgi:hypothetical protein
MLQYCASTTPAGLTAIFAELLTAHAASEAAIGASAAARGSGTDDVFSPTQVQMPATPLFMEMGSTTPFPGAHLASSLSAPVTAAVNGPASLLGAFPPHASAPGSPAHAARGTPVAALFQDTQSPSGPVTSALMPLAVTELRTLSSQPLNASTGSSQAGTPTGGSPSLMQRQVSQPGPQSSSNSSPIMKRQSSSPASSGPTLAASLQALSFRPPVSRSHLSASSRSASPAESPTGTGSPGPLSVLAAARRPAPPAPPSASSSQTSVLGDDIATARNSASLPSKPAPSPLTAAAATAAAATALSTVLVSPTPTSAAEAMGKDASAMLRSMADSEGSSRSQPAAPEREQMATSEATQASAGVSAQSAVHEAHEAQSLDVSTYAMDIGDAWAQALASEVSALASMASGEMWPDDSVADWAQEHRDTPDEDPDALIETATQPTAALPTHAGALGLGTAKASQSLSSKQSDSSGVGSSSLSVVLSGLLGSSVVDDTEPLPSVQLPVLGGAGFALSGLDDDGTLV